MVFGDDLGGRGGFDRHQGLPHGAIDEIAFFGGLLVGHCGPVASENYVGVVSAELFEFDALFARKAFGEAIDVAEGVGFEIDVKGGVAEVGPDGVEHEAQDDCVGGAEDAELPADEVVVDDSFFAGPEAIEDSHKDCRTNDGAEEEDDVLGEGQHEVAVSRSETDYRIFFVMPDLN